MESSQQAQEEIKAHATDALHRADTYVRENPIPTILGALAVGFFIGLLVHTPEPTPKSRWNDLRDDLRNKADDSRDELRGLLEAIAKKSKKAYKKSSSQVRDAVKEATDAASNIDLDDYTDPVSSWFQRLWRKVS